jgi:hypothetical protein
MNLRNKVFACISLFFFACTLVPACSESTGNTSLEWGTGAKADEEPCDATADLCWDNPRDKDSITQIITLESDIILERAELPKALDDMAYLLSDLSHKLTSAEWNYLEKFKTEIANLSTEPTLEEVLPLMTELRQNITTRLSAVYHSAHMIPVGIAAEHELAGAADDPDDPDNPLKDLDGDFTMYSEGIQESLRLLRESGALGKGYSTLLKASGVLDRDYEIINAINFGEYDPSTYRIIPNGISREARVKKIRHQYSLLGGFIGAATGAESMIPVAGSAIAILHETYALFRIHAQMVFEIASVYGIDIRENRNLLIMTLILINEGLMAEAIDIVATCIITPLIVKKAAKKLGITLAPTLAKNIANRSLTLFLNMFRKKSQEALAKAALTQGGKAVGKTVLGWATLGFTILVSAGVDYWITDLMGRKTAVSAKQWLHDLYMEAGTFISLPPARDCAFKTVGAMITVDQAVAEREALLYQAILAKPYYVDDSSWYFLTQEERIWYSERLRDVFTSDTAKEDALACLEEDFKDATSAQKLSFVAWLYGVIQVDTVEDPVEKEFYDEIVELLDRRGFLVSGSKIDHTQLAYAERSIFISIHPGQAGISEEYQEFTEMIIPEDVFDFLKEPNPLVQADFDCGFKGVCSE